MRWIDVIGYEGLYQVSDTGLVKSYDKIRTGDFYTTKRRFYKGKVLRASKGRDYLLVILTKDKKHKTCLVHRLVAQAFIPNPDNKPNVNHIDFNPENNNANNLEWCTQFENIHHTMAHGRDNAPKGQANGMSKIKNREVKTIHRMYAKGAKQSEIARFFGVHQSAVSLILNRKTFKHISL